MKKTKNVNYFCLFIIFIVFQGEEVRKKFKFLSTIDFFSIQKGFEGELKERKQNKKCRKAGNVIHQWPGNKNFVQNFNLESGLVSKKRADKKKGEKEEGEKV